MCARMDGSMCALFTISRVFYFIQIFAHPHDSWMKHPRAQPACSRIGCGVDGHKFDLIFKFSWNFNLKISYENLDFLKNLLINNRTIYPSTKSSQIIPQSPRVVVPIHLPLSSSLSVGLVVCVVVDSLDFLSRIFCLFNSALNSRLAAGSRNKCRFFSSCALSVFIPNKLL